MSIAAVVGGFITWPIDRFTYKQRLLLLDDKYEELRDMYLEKIKKFEAWKTQQSGLIAKHENASAAWEKSNRFYQTTAEEQKEIITSLQDQITSLIQNCDKKTEVIVDREQMVEVYATQVGDLRHSLTIERLRFDKAIQHEREVGDGQRYRLGQIPGPRVETDGKSPIQTRRPPWSEVARTAEAKSRKSPVKEVQQNEQHWKDKIAEVEAKDQEQAEQSKE